MFYTLIKHRFLTNQSAQCPISILKLDKNTVHVFYFLIKGFITWNRLLFSHGEYFTLSSLLICLQSNAAALLQSMTNRLKTEARHSQDVDVIQQVGAGLLNGMSYVLNILTKNEPTDEKQLGKALKSNEQLEKFDAKLNKVRGY